MNDRKKLYIKIAKIAGCAVLAALTVYLVYGLIGAVATFYKQPIFVADDGGTSRSFGFMVTAFMFMGLLAVIIVADILYYYFLYLRPKRKARKKSEQERESFEPQTAERTHENPEADSD